MSEFIIERTGTPFQEEMLEELKAFLETEDLQYDDNISYSVVIEDETGFIASGSLDSNVLKCIAVKQSFQGQGLMTRVVMHLIERLIETGIFHYFVFTKPANKQQFLDLGFYPIVCTEDVLFLENEQWGLQKYLDQLVEETKETAGETAASQAVHGAIIANCNPFTYGHQYLMKEASKRCDWLHVFVLSAEHQMFSAKERFDMVKLGTKAIPNLIIHRTSDYLVSPAVFPTYFIKDKAKAAAINCMVDLKIFSDYVAKTLNITRRFVGEEPYCQVTHKYNECMKSYLPQQGIEVCECPRKESHGIGISASFVRKAMEEGNKEILADFVPVSTLDYVKRIRKWRESEPISFENSCIANGN